MAVKAAVGAMFEHAAARMAAAVENFIFKLIRSDYLQLPSVNDQDEVGMLRVGFYDRYSLTLTAIATYLRLRSF